MIIACATDDGINFCDRHFGDAEFYYIYQIDKNSINFINKIKNTTEDEIEHADPIKAKGIINILKKQNIDIGFTLVFGPNIKRIVKKLLPIVSNTIVIEDGLYAIQSNYDKVFELLENNKNCFFNLNTNKVVIINK
ncbi:MAG: hypothetical protein B6227_05625 [Fusobacteriia bacterium 4572_74]|nr:MAG: hypothetical protein B6227_05625 [Fusobacteriia bacterium 4572_74]